MITYSLTGTSSGLGFSHYYKYGQCPLKATLDAAAGQGEHNSSQGTDEGKLGHALLELYYSGYVFEPEDIFFDPQPKGDVRTEMSRVFNQYRVKYPADEWGKIISIEEQIDGEIISEVMGVPYSMRADMVIAVDTEEMVERLVDKRPSLVGLRPGVYGVDHKFLKRRPSNLEIKYPNSLQFVGYQLGWNATHPTQAVDGWIVNVVVKTKEVQFYTLFVPPPSEAQIKSLKTSLQYWKWIKDNLPNQTNPQEDYCFGFVEPCWWFKNNVCDRGQGDDLVKLPRRAA